MLAIDPVASAVAAAILVAIYQFIQRTAVPVRWRDSLTAYRFRRIKERLRELVTEEQGPADWRPQILAFTESEERRGRVLEFAEWIVGGSGMITAVRIVEGEGTAESVRDGCREAEAALRAEIGERKIDAYALAVGAPDLRTAFATIVQTWGVGPIRSNTVLVNWPGEPGDPTSARWYARLLANAGRLRQNVVVLDTDETAWIRLEELPNDKRRIDVWWFDDESSRMMLLFAYLMTRNEEWDEGKIRVLIPAASKSAQKVEEHVRARLEEGRIEATVRAVPGILAAHVRVEPGAALWRPRQPARRHDRWLLRSSFGRASPSRRLRGVVLQGVGQQEEGDGPAEVPLRERGGP